METLARQKEQAGAGGVAQLEHVLSMYEALGLISGKGGRKTGRERERRREKRRKEGRKEDRQQQPWQRWACAWHI
jgi:hypothetical protein